MKNRLGLIAIAIVCLWLPALSAVGEVLVAPNAVWKYLDNGSNQGTAWRGTNFNDAAWASGPAELGYGDFDEATVVGYGPNPNDRYATTYFRHKFTIIDKSTVTALVVRVLRDDGAVVYLNGVEVARSNMGDGAIDSNDHADESIGEGAELIFHAFDVSPTRLVNGTNTIAVEVHQVDKFSSDLSFALELIAAHKTFVQAGQTWRYFKGTSFPGTNWNTLAFNDAAWLSGPSGFGYGDEDDATLIEDMEENYGSLFTRRKFVVENPAIITNLVLTADFDDGFVAYINGVEVARRAMPAGTPTHTTFASEPHEASGGDTLSEPLAKEYITIDASSLVAGTNVLAVSGHNLDLDSTDFTLIVGLMADIRPDLEPPLLTVDAPADYTTTFSPSIAVSGTAVDAYLGVQGVTVKGTAATSGNLFTNWTATVGLVPGTNLLTTIARDAAIPPNTTTSTLHVVYIDQDLPTLTVQSPTEWSTALVANVSVTGVAQDPGSGIAGVTVNGYAATSTNAFANWTVIVPGMTLGTNVLTAIAADYALPPHSVTSVVQFIVIDGSGPNIAITSPSNMSTTTVATINLSGTSIDSLTSVLNVEVNGLAVGTANAFTNWSATISGLGLGTNTLRAIATDTSELANTATAVVQVVYVDVVAPSLSINSPANLSVTTTNAVTVSGTSLDSLSGVLDVKVNGATATSGNSFTNWSANVSGLNVGTNTFVVVARDKATPPNAITNSVQVVYVDQAPPNVAISAPLDGATTTARVVAVSGTASDPGSGVASVTVNGGLATTANQFATWNRSVTLPVGSNSVVAIATDQGQPANTSTTTVTVIVNDLTRPLLAISSPANNSTSTVNSVVLSGTSSDEQSQVANVTVNGIAATTTNSFAQWSVTVPGLTIGTNTLTAIAVDSSVAANARTNTLNVIYVDVNPPALAVTSPLNLSTTLVNSVSVTGTAEDPLTGILQVLVNGASATTTNGFTNWTANVTGLKVGSNSVVTIARDKATPPNATTNSIQVIYIDQDAPSLSVTTPLDLAEVTVSSVSVTGTASDAGSGITNVTVNGVLATTSNQFTNWTRNVTGLTFGTNNLIVVATDRGVPPNQTTNTVRVLLVDHTPPVLTISSPTNLTTTTSQSLMVTGTAVDAVAGVLDVKVNGVNATSANSFTNWSATVSNLPVGTNTLMAIANDKNIPPNVSTSSVQVVVLDNGAPSVAFTSPSNLSTTTVKTVEVTGTAVDDTGVAGLTVNGFTAATTNAFANWTASVSNLVVGTNNLIAIATDQSLPPHHTTNVLQVIYVDLIPPLLAIDAPVDLSTTMVASVTVSGTASDPESGVAGVSVNGSAAGSTNAHANWSVLIQDLIAGVTNNLQVIATDSGLPPNTTTNIVRVIFIDGGAPLLEVTSPADLSYTTNADVVVTGTAEDSVTGVANVIVNGVSATTQNLFTNWTATISGLAAGTNELMAVATDFDNPANATTNTVRVIYANATFDGDGDGMSDAWEIQYFGSVGANPNDDFDGDGKTNLQEFLSQTSPIDPQSLLAVRSLRFTNDTWQVTWNAVSGLTYRVQFSTNLSALAWIDLAGDVTATNSAASKDAGPLNSSRGYYRIMLAPPP